MADSFLLNEDGSGGHLVFEDGSGDLLLEPALVANPIQEIRPTSSMNGNRTAMYCIEPNDAG